LARTSEHIFVPIDEPHGISRRRSSASVASLKFIEEQPQILRLTTPELKDVRARSLRMTASSVWLILGSGYLPLVEFGQISSSSMSTSPPGKGPRSMGMGVDEQRTRAFIAGRANRFAKTSRGDSGVPAIPRRQTRRWSVPTAREKSRSSFAGIYREARLVAGEMSEPAICGAFSCSVSILMDG